MMSVLCRWIISNRTDDGRPLPAFVARRLARDADLRRFADGVARLDRSLRAAPPEMDRPSAQLRSRTVMALYEQRREAVNGWGWAWLGGVVAACSVALAVSLALLPRNGTTGAPKISQRHADGRAGSTRQAPPIALGEAFLRLVSNPAGADSPLIGEARSLVNDTRRAATRVLAQLPTGFTRAQ